jgi:hypothetical protein
VYNRLFTQILDSSVWILPDAVRIVWITLLASQDEDFFCHFSTVENLARRAGVSVENARKAVEIFTSPDPDSGDQDFEGRRIERVPGGFLVLNGPKYRELAGRLEQREQTRTRVQRFREKHSVGESVTACNADVTACNADVTKCNDFRSVSVSASASGSEGKSAEKGMRKSACLPGLEPASRRQARGTKEEVVAYAVSVGLTKTDGEWFYETRQGNGWTNGGKAIRDYQATIRAWKLQGDIFPSQRRARSGQSRSMMVGTGDGIARAAGGRGNL